MKSTSSGLMPALFMRWLIANAPDGFEVYSGDDGFTLPLLATGTTIFMRASISASCSYWPVHLR